MKKMNKKGFTLIEMLVVIAIIAVLVSIIIPVVGNSTDKAAAATNAANLRSCKAEITTAYLTNDTGRWTFGAIATGSTTGTVTTAEGNLPTFKDMAKAPSAPTGYTFKGTYNANGGFSATYDANGNIIVTYDGLRIDDWAALANTTPGK